MRSNCERTKKNLGRMILYFHYFSTKLQHKEKQVDLLLLDGVVHVREAALAAVLAIEMGGHENSGTALLAGTLAAKAMDLAVIVDLKR